MKKVYIETTGGETKIAVTQDGILTDYAVEKTPSLVGSVFVGHVKTILSEGYTFIDIGTGKNAFTNLKKGHGLKAGDCAVFQVQKDAHGDKGAYVSPALSLRSACAVLSEDPTHEVGASRKIPHEKERTRLKKIARGIAPTGHGLILRTAAASLPRETIEADVKALHATMQSIRARGQYAAAGTVLHHAPNPLTMGAHEILDAIPPEISRQLDLSPQIALPCGGNIIIEQTSACVVIDVNTGGNVTEPMQTNMNAATAIARQLRLRNLSGIIIVDFISMRTKTDQRTLTTALREATKTDPLRTDVLGLTSLGLMQITRERTRPPHM